MANILLLCVRLFELSLWERRYQIQPTDSRRQACDPEQTVLHPELTPGLSGWHANSHITWKNLIFPSIFLQLLLRLILLLLLLCVERFHFLKNLKNASIQLFLLILLLLPLLLVVLLVLSLFPLFCLGVPKFKGRGDYSFFLGGGEYGGPGGMREYQCMISMSLNLIGAGLDTPGILVSLGCITGFRKYRWSP